MEHLEIHSFLKVIYTTYILIFSCINAQTVNCKEPINYVMMVMKNCFCGIVERRNTFSFISCWDHCPRPSSWVPNKPRAGFELAPSLSSVFIEWSCVAVITTTPRHPEMGKKLKITLYKSKLQNFKNSLKCQDNILIWSRNKERSNYSFLTNTKIMGKYIP